MATSDYTVKAYIRFWSKVAITADNEKCWEWQAYVDKYGYGRFAYGKDVLCNRVVWVLIHGAIPDGLHILHTCDNPRCVNPNHLFTGTAKQNAEDRERKGRGGHNKNHARGNGISGEQHGMCKLTDRQVLEIRHRYATESITQTALGGEYQVSGNLVSRIVTKKHRANIQENSNVQA